MDEAAQERHANGGPCVEPWQKAESLFPISHGEVHVWRAHVPSLLDHLPRFEACLIPSERDRARRFRIEADRRRYIAAQGLVRILLGFHLECDPEEVPLQHGPHGKPSVAPGTASLDLRFNNTHTHEMVAAVFAMGREVGIDVEHVRPKRVNERFVRRFFSPREAASWFALAPGQREDAFFRCWTRKEAYLKARGEGLKLPLQQFTVALSPEEPPALLAVVWDPRETSRWFMADLAPGPGYAGAVVVEGTPHRIRRWDFTVP